MKNILLLGGTGAMGAHLGQILARRGDKVTITSRAPRAPSANIEYILGNAKDELFLKSILNRRWDAIVDFMVYTTPAFTQRAPTLLSATDQYIYLSSARVYAESSHPIVEESPRLLDTIGDHQYLATDEYALAKARQEDALRQLGRTNWTIIRPYITYSEQRLQLGILEKEGWLYRALRGRAIVFSQDMAQKRTTLTHGFDVSAAIVLLIGKSEALGQTFHITQPESKTWHEILELYLDVIEAHLGSRPKVRLLGLDDFAQCKRAEYQTKYDRLYDRVFDNGKIAAAAGVQHLKAPEQGLAESLQQFLRKPDFQKIDWRSEAIKDRYSGEVARLSEISDLRQIIKYLYYRFVQIRTPKAVNL